MDLLFDRQAVFSKKMEALGVQTAKAHRCRRKLPITARDRGDTDMQRRRTFLATSTAVSLINVGYSVANQAKATEPVSALA
jgi:hypothetical protein